MKTILLVAITTLITISTLPGCVEVPANGVPPAYANGWIPPVKKSMRAFRSDQELKSYLKELAEKQRLVARRAELQSEAAPSLSANQVASPAKSGAAKDDSVTNTQHAGVDEGGIVKLHGDHLVVLRRGRLFTVKVGDGLLKPISAVDAFGPDIDPGSTWYDEMLVSDDTIAVIGYSYQRGGTEVGLFNIDRAGQITYRSTHHLRSNDYYSSRNYASRLIGSKLIYYTPLYLNFWDDPMGMMPAMRHWPQKEFQRIAPATRIYRTDDPLDPSQGLALHSV